MQIITADHSTLLRTAYLQIIQSPTFSTVLYVHLCVNVYFLKSYSGKCVNVRLMTETWCSRETARATAKPQIEFSRQGDNPRSYLISQLIFL